MEPERLTLSFFPTVENPSPDDRRFGVVGFVAGGGGVTLLCDDSPVGLSASMQTDPADLLNLAASVSTICWSAASAKACSKIFFSLADKALEEVGAGLSLSVLVFMVAHDTTLAHQLVDSSHQDAQVKHK